MPLQLNDQDLMVLIVRIDERTEAIQKNFTKIEKAVEEKADSDRVERLEERVSKSEDKHEKTDRKLSYILGGLIVGEALLKLAFH